VSLEPNKVVVRRFIAEVWNAGNLDAADELVHPDYEVPGVGHGSDAVKRNVTAFRAAFPDLAWTIATMIAEGDWVAVRLILRGTHLGEFRGIAPTGTRVTIQEMVFWQVDNGKLCAGWFQADTLGLRVQLGVLPPE